MLARALSRDLQMGRLRDLWLEKADATELLASEAKAHVSSKRFLRPLFWLAGLTGMGLINKLSLRSRWFQPPVDGPKMTALMYDAVPLRKILPPDNISSLGRQTFPPLYLVN
jgi:hypothetical protein